MSEEAISQLVDRIEKSQWRVAIVVGLGSTLLSVSLAWMLARSDVSKVHEMILSATCKCSREATHTNTMTINTDTARDDAIRDILKKQGHIDHD